MNEPLTIWHNPRCSKSRQTLQLLHERGFKPIEVDYQNHPPNAREITVILQKLGLSARQLMRKGEDIYKELELAKQQDEKKLINAMVNHPVLIERPVVLFGDKAALGRPPQAVSSIL